MKNALYYGVTVASLSILMVVTACSENATGTAADLAGTWQLETVNGSPLPYGFDLGDSVTNEVLDLKADGTMVESYAGVHSGQAFTLPSSGTWWVSGGSLFILDLLSEFIGGTFTPDPVTHRTMRLTLDGETWIYSRR
ncbi:MAG: lipocalin family protein [Gemmatimonadaceae bacterium]